MKNRAVFLIFIFAVSVFSAFAQTENIAPNQPASEKTIAGKQIHLYQFAAPKNGFVQIRVQQKGVDLVINLLAPTGEKIAERDAPNGNFGAEILSLAATAENYKIEIKPLDDTAATGNYSIAVVTKNKPEAYDLIRIEAENAFGAAQVLRGQNTPESFKSAAQKYEIALAGWQKINDKYFESLTLGSLAAVQFQTETEEKIIKMLQRAADLAREVGDKYLETTHFRSLGDAYLQFGKTDKARELFQKSIDQARVNNDADNQIYGWQSLGGSYFAAKDYKKAAEIYEQKILPLIRAKNSRPLEAVWLNYTGVIVSYFDNGRAIEFYTAANKIYAELGNVEQQILILTNIGTANKEQNKKDAALENYRQALTLAKSAALDSKTVVTLEKITAILDELNRHEENAAAHVEIIALYQKLKDRSKEALWLNSLANVHIKNKQPEKGLELQKESLKIYRELKNAAEEGQLLQNIGINLAALERRAEAVESYKLALEIQKTLKNFVKAARVSRSIGENYFKLKDAAKASAAYQESVALARLSSDRAELALELNYYGVYQTNTKNYAEAIKLQTESLEIYRELKDKINEALLLSNVAVNTANLKDFPKAIELYNQSIKLRRENGEQLKVAETLLNLGDAHKSAEQFADALTNYTEAQKIYVELKDRQGETRSIHKTAILYSDWSDKTNQADQAALALVNFQKALEMAQQLGNKEVEAQIFRNLGSHFYDKKENQKAIDYYEIALKMRHEQKSKSEEAELLINIGQSHDSLGNYDKAAEYFQQSLQLYQELNNLAKQGEVLNLLGVAYSKKDDTAKSLEYYRQSLKILEKTGNREDLMYANGNLANIMFQFSQDAAALQYSETALTLAREIKNREYQAKELNKLGKINFRLGNKLKAFELFKDASTIASELNNKVLLASISFDTANSLIRFSDADSRKMAFDLFQMSLFLYRAVGERANEAGSLQGMAFYHYLRGEYPETLRYLQESLPLVLESKEKNNIASLFANFMMLLSKQKNVDKNLAIFYGKQAVNLYQQSRADIKDVDQDLQQSFLKSNESTYRKLADLLIEAGRLAEAQQVLAMLKEEEASEFSKRDAKEIETLSKRTDLLADEKIALEKFNALSGNLTQKGAEFAALQKKRSKLAEGEVFAEETQFKVLEKEIETANAAFRLFLEKQLSAEIGKAQTEKIELDRALQGDLAKWGKGTVALTTVVGDDRYRVILTTAAARVDGKTEISVGDLNRKIFEFRAALRNPSQDPRPLGLELYNILIKPIEKDLQGAGAKTLLWSLDGTLRYVPLAALWDGEQYLVQKYQNVILTSTTRASLSAQNDNDWRALGAGVTKESSVKIASGETIGFGGLPSVSNELLMIVRNAATEKGLLSGRRFLDGDFTFDALKNSLGKTDDEDRRLYNVVHLATHFRLGIDKTDSFLLLGNGQALTLAKVSDTPDFNFKDVELVTLSACNTAFGNSAKRTNTESKDDPNGKEVDSLAAFIENRGAKAVIATLWAVADESTQLVMGEFYRLKTANPKMTKAEAMQAAQIAMIEGKLKPTTTDSLNRAETVSTRGDPLDTTTLNFQFDKNKAYSHPYFWSPFVLIGNWR